MKVKIGSIVKTTDDKLVSNKDDRSSNKNRFLSVVSVEQETDNLLGIKIYTHDDNISNDDVIVDANPRLPKQSAFGKHIISHEYVKDKEGKEQMVRLNMKNGNLKLTGYSTTSENVNKALGKMSSREKRKYRRNK